MLKPWQKVLIVAALFAYVILIWAWASFGYPTEAQICEPSGSGQNCDSYNILFALAWNLGEKLNHWSALIAAAATILIAWFTLTLKRSTDNLWAAAEQQRADIKTASEKQFKNTEESIKLARDEFISSHRPRIILREAIIDTVVEGELISITYHLANIGETTGRIIRKLDKSRGSSAQRKLGPTWKCGRQIRSW